MHEADPLGRVGDHTSACKTGVPTVLMDKMTLVVLARIHCSGNGTRRQPWLYHEVNFATSS